MDDYLCVTLLSKPGESDGVFASRLMEFWSYMLKEHQDEFEKVYAETTEFEQESNMWSRQYLCELSVIDFLQEQLTAAKIDFEPIDKDDLYSKYEAVPPEWMQIEH